MSKRLALAGIGVALLCGALVTGPPAHAATSRNGVCETGEFCLYYNSNHSGSMVDLATSVSDYGSSSSTCVKFITSGSGRGACVKNNAASVWNRESALVTVFYKSGYAGRIDAIRAGDKVNLNAVLKNENAGHLVGSSSNTNLELALYRDTAAQMTAYYDGYLNTEGRHEGTDIKLGIGKPVYALVSGRVLNVEEGVAGGALSTVAIYNAAEDNTVVYLHLNPVDRLDTGDTVSRGELIGNESTRGISESAAHTHVEVRIGQKTHAAKSVGDPDLENPNPTAFWMRQGYNICCD